MTFSVLHLPFETAGQAAIQAAALRKCGVRASTLYPAHRFAYGAQPDYSCPVRPRGWSDLVRAWRALQLAGRFDVFHYHYAASLLPWQLGFPDARLNRKLGKAVVTEFWGSDVRVPSIESARNPWYVNGYNESDKRSLAVMARWADITSGHAIIADDSFVAAASPYFPHLHRVRQAIDAAAVTPVYPPPENKKPVLVHIPSHHDVKGTPFVRAAVENLRQRGLEFDYREISGVSHAEAQRLCAQADLVIDQLRLGSHGMFAVEAMALGKPVVCYILPELEAAYPGGFPIINANPETLVAVLEEWIVAGGELRAQRGRQSRAYVEQHHDSPVVARALLDAYRQLPGFPV